MLCTICYSTFKKKTSLSCCHSFCYDCIETWKTHKRDLGRQPNCPVCRRVFNISQYSFPESNIRERPNYNYRVYMNTRNRTQLKRFMYLHDYILNLIQEINQARILSSHTLTEIERVDLRIIKLLKCLDRNSWFLQKNSWGRTMEKEEQRKCFIKVLELKLNEWRENGFIMANCFIYKFRKFF